jgi:dipeptidase E
MRLLLTASGVNNPSIREALVAIYPHLDHPDLPSNTMANAEKWSATLDCASYAIDDDTAIRVVDGRIDVISEGQWRRFEAPAG